jgi:hypothetical protein
MIQGGSLGESDADLCSTPFLGRFGGVALMLALGKVKPRAKKLAAQVSEVLPTDLVSEEGRIYIRWLWHGYMRNERCCVH